MKTFIRLFCSFCCLSLISIFSLNAQAQTTAEITKGNCDACVTECQKTLDYCTKKGGRYKDATVTNALKDCITACKACSDSIARGSTLTSKTVAMCIEACTNCAKSCESFRDDNNMRACADECRKTIGNCQKINSGK